MKLIHSPVCDLCSLGQVGSFLHMFWECPAVSSFWKLVSSTLSELLEVDIPCSPEILLLNDTSLLNLSSTRTHTLLAGLTAAKKMLALRWKPPHTLTRAQWLQTFLSILYMEMSVARMHGASQKTIQTWASVAAMVKDLLEWEMCICVLVLVYLLVFLFLFSLFFTYILAYRNLGAV